MQSKFLLLIGGTGNLGRAVVKEFKSNWHVVSIDLRSNKDANTSIELNENESYPDFLFRSYKELDKVTNKFDSIISTAGGWCGGSINNSSIFSEIEKMNKMNLYSSVLAGHLATRYLKDKGLLVFTGAAAPFKEPTPGMLAYALSKTAVHSLAINMAQSSDLPKESVVTCILPEVIDTPDNRKAMPESDFSKWTSPEAIAGLVKMWAEGANRPKNGSFAIMKKVNDMVVPEFV